jgi:ribosomal protein S18 acetylase RimI-like enzyme
MLRRLTVDDMNAFRELREEAIRLCPESFGSPEEGQGREQQEAAYKDILQKDEILGAFEDEKLVGAIGLHLPSDPKSQSHSKIFSVYVLNAYQGKGIGNLLVKQVLALAKDRTNQSHLCVAHTAKAAIAVFQKNGFEIRNTEANAFSLGDKSYDELLLVKSFR